MLHQSKNTLAKAMLATMLCICLPAWGGNLDEKIKERLTKEYQDWPKTTAGDWAKFDAHPLGIWLRQKQLLTENHWSEDKVRDFIKQHPLSIATQEVQSFWLKRLEKNDQLESAMTIPKLSDEPVELGCVRHQLRLNRTTDKETLQAALLHWENLPNSIPALCDALIKKLLQVGSLKPETLFYHLGQTLIPKNHLSTSKRLAKQLPRKLEKLALIWTQARKSPSKSINKLLTMPDTDHTREVAVYAVQRAADIKLATAQKYWPKLAKHFDFTPKQIGAVEARIGRWLGWRHDTKTIDKISNISAENRTEEGHNWLARMLLREGRWQDLKTAIEAMPTALQEETRWQYWLARSLEELGEQAKANAIFEKQAGPATFYGFLSADKIKAPYSALQAEPPNRLEKLIPLLKQPEISRWKAWEALGLSNQARKEWFHLLKRLSKSEVLALAAWVKDYDPNLTIWTSSRVKAWDAVDIRFPTQYWKKIESTAKKLSIDPSWAMGVLRRESAFDKMAKSHANARGLMQLLPATAQGVAKRQGVKGYKSSKLYDPAYNIRLGCGYLAEMLDKFDGHIALATAAYNAGPHRIPKWRPQKSIAADQWIESIPFEETRRYVRAVLTYQTIYANQFLDEGMVRLTPRLAVVGVQ